MSIRRYYTSVKALCVSPNPIVEAWPDLTRPCLCGQDATHCCWYSYEWKSRSGTDCLERCEAHAIRWAAKKGVPIQAEPPKASLMSGLAVTNQ